MKGGQKVTVIAGIPRQNIGTLVIAEPIEISEEGRPRFEVIETISVREASDDVLATIMATYPRAELLYLLESRKVFPEWQKIAETIQR